MFGSDNRLVDHIIWVCGLAHERLENDPHHTRPGGEVSLNAAPSGDYWFIHHESFHAIRDEYALVINQRTGPVSLGCIDHSRSMIP